MQVNPVVQSTKDWLSGLQEKPGRILAAVSGGSDSLAMLMALKDALSDTGVELFAATIDHDLRPEAKREAEQVASLCDAQGIPHSILKVQWHETDVPSQAKARHHRYVCLAAEAKQIGASVIATGHTKDDQAETFLLRLRAGSGAWGLAGIAAESPFPIWPDGDGLTVCRPVLGLTRSTLRTYLKELKFDWVDDPSNENDAYERVRVRKLISARPEIKASALTTQTRLASLRIRMSEYLMDWSSRHLDWKIGGAALLNAKALSGLSSQLRLRFLQHVLPAVSGVPNMPRSDALCELSAALGDGEARVRTLSGCRIEQSENQLMISAELIDKSAFLPSSDEFYWQKRIKFHLSGLEKRQVFVSVWDERPVPSRLNAARELPFHIRASLPVLLNEAGEIECVPHLENQSGLTVTDLAPLRLKRWLKTKYIENSSETAAKESFSA